MEEVSRESESKEAKWTGQGKREGAPDRIPASNGSSEGRKNH